MSAARKMPRGFREGHGGDLACPHRDVSCCRACAVAHPEIVEVYSQHFWVADPVEREALQRATDPDAVAERAAEYAACRGEFL